MKLEVDRLKVMGRKDNGESIEILMKKKGIFSTLVEKIDEKAYVDNINNSNFC